MTAKWAPAGALANLEYAGGANATAKHLVFDNVDSYAGSITAADLITPAAGNYKLTFYYKNGQVTDGTRTPMSNLQVFLKQGGNNVAQFDIPAAQQTNWTLAEMPVVALAATPVSVYIFANSPAGPIAPATGEVSAFDEFNLVQSATIPLTVTPNPPATIILSNVRTITAKPNGGSGTYTHVEFDVNADGTVDHTDSAAPFTFDWDTRTIVAAGSQGSAVLKITAYDNASGYGTNTFTYAVDNRWGGRVSFVTNSTFDGYSGVGVPAGWLVFQQTGDQTVEADNSSYPGGNPPCVKITYAASDYTNRYTIRTPAQTGLFVNMQTWYWGKGANNRVFYVRSTDGGVTFTPEIAAPAAAVNNASWTFAVGGTQTLTTADTDQIAVATHNFAPAAEGSFYDDVYSEGTKDLGADVGDWNLY
jgi:hypothetical protein